MKAILSTTAAVLLLSATAASAESAVVEARKQLAAQFAQEQIETRAQTGRQATSAARPGFFDSLFGAEIRFGIGEIETGETPFAGRKDGSDVRSRLGGRFNPNR
ncbi:MAG: hypothetical protein ACFBRM_08430 [Pikeienuella sp.]